MELKTLKDVVDTYGGRSIGDVEALSKTTMSPKEVIECVHILNHVWTDLRQSAIGWIKHIENDIKVIEEAKLHPQGPCDGMVTHGLTEELEGQITWIKMFFNLTEEDLKCEK